MSPRTSWDAPETEAVRGYRRRRRAKGVDTDDAEDLGAESIREISSTSNMGDTGDSPAAVTRRQEALFDSNIERDSALRRKKVRRGSGGATFTSSDAANALANRRK
jgi:hypothetical protein